MSTFSFPPANSYTHIHNCSRKYLPHSQYSRPDRLKYASAEFWLSPDSEDHMQFLDRWLNLVLRRSTTSLCRRHPIRAAHSPHRFLMLTHCAASERCSTIAAPLWTLWTSRRKRWPTAENVYDSFSKSEHLKGKLFAYQLAQLGFFFVGDRNSPGKLRCSFCRRTIHMFTTDDAPHLEKDFDRRLIALLHRHAHLSATCPFALGLNGDDKRFSADDIASSDRSIDSIASYPIWLHRPKHISTTQIPVDLRITRLHQWSVNSHTDCLHSMARCPTHITIWSPRSTTRRVPHSSRQPDFETELSTHRWLDATRQRQSTTSSESNRSTGTTWPSRAESTRSTWRRGGSTRYREPTRHFWSPNRSRRRASTTRATADNVMCFWCGLGLNQWEATDDPVTEHVRFTPRCTWLLRKFGRQRVKYLYLKANGNRSGAGTAVQNIKPTDTPSFVMLKILLVRFRVS